MRIQKSYRSLRQSVSGQFYFDRIARDKEKAHPCVRCQPFPRLHINGSRQQANVAAPAPNRPECSLGMLFVPAVPGQSTQGRELEHQAASARAAGVGGFILHLWLHRIRMPASSTIILLGPPGIQRRIFVERYPITKIDPGIRDPSLSIEDREQTIAQVLCKAQELPVIYQTVGPYNPMAIGGESALIPSRCKLPLFLRRRVTSDR